MRFKLLLLWWDIRDRVDGWLPYRCPCCGRWVQRQTMRRAQHRIAGWVELCRTCYQNLYGN